MERAAPKGAQLEAESRFWDDHAEGMWQRLADSGFSPRYLHSVFIGRGHIPFPKFRGLLRDAHVKLLPPGKWRDRTLPKGRKSEKTWTFRGAKRTLDDLLEFAADGVTRAALRFRLTESRWSVDDALSKPLMSRSESGSLGASISNKPTRKRG